MPQGTPIQLRRGTAAAWTAANPILLAGEPGFETDTRLTKYGDGTTAWTALSYAGAAAGATLQDYKESVRASTAAAITTLAGGAPNITDGVTLVAGDRILVKNQATASQNGIYSVTTLGTGANGTWTRTTDADAAGELTTGVSLWVEEGTLNGGKRFTLTTTGAITIGTTALTFAITGGAIDGGTP
jgi:hypothetical protein